MAFQASKKHAAALMLLNDGRCHWGRLSQRQCKRRDVEMLKSPGIDATREQANFDVENER